MNRRGLLLCAALMLWVAVLKANTWNADILPPEQRIETDAESGARVIFITTDKSNDTNLYFHDRSWLLENQIMLFMSDRSGRNELYAYVANTGHLARLNRKMDAPAYGAVASRNGDRIYVIRDNTVLEWRVQLSGENTPVLEIAERKICDFPAGSAPFGSLNENSDGTLLSVGYMKDDQPHIAVVNIREQLMETILQPDQRMIQHIQFSRERPDLLSFAVGYGSDTAPLDTSAPAHARIWFLNIHIKMAVPAFYQKPGELVTHECWWVNDQMTFIGGHLPGEAHVKVLDLKTNEIKIIGAGAWWEGASDRALAQVNWWHASGSPDGKWVAADNWHGTISIFNAKTTQKKILTAGHRVYGGGAHPHVGWDLNGKSVVFGSNKNGNPDVCIAFIPENWQ